MLGRSISIAVATLLAVVVMAETPVIPAVIPNPGAQRLDWVAADVAVTADGQLREEMLGDFTTSLRELARANTARLARENPGTTGDPCRLYRGTIPNHFKRTGSLEELTSEAALIVSGEVMATREGFFGGLPGRLLLLAPRYLKGNSAPAPLLFYPFARIETADGVICAKPLGDFVPPEIGDRVLIFAMGAPRIDHGPAILSVNVTRQLVHEPRTGPIRLPDVLRTNANAPVTLSDVERAVVRSLEKSSRTR